MLPPPANLDLQALAPEIVMGIGGLAVLLLDLTAFRKSDDSRRRVALGLVTLGVGVVSLAAALPAFGTASGLSAWLDLILAGVFLIAISPALATPFTERWGEFYALTCWATVGMMVLASADDLLTLFLALEAMTICLYLLAAIETTRRRSAEAGMKYFVYGSVSSALMLYGLSLVYGMAGSLRIDTIGRALAGGADLAGVLTMLLVVVGFGFKVAAVPFHQWLPDTSEGAPAPVAAWIASGSKIASVVAMLRLFLVGFGGWSHDDGSLFGPGWIGLLAVMAAVSMTYGNMAALSQRNFKRLLAYSSVAQAGYLLVGVVAAGVTQGGDNGKAVGATLYYLVAYAVATAGAFAVAAWLVRDTGGEDVDDLAGLGGRSPVLAVSIAVLMISLIGIPPTAGFIGKLTMFMEALDTKESGQGLITGLVGLALINTVVSAFYYVRVLKLMYLRPATDSRLSPAGWAIAGPIVVAAILMPLLGLIPGLLLDPMTEAGRSFVEPTSIATGAGR